MVESASRYLSDELDTRQAVIFVTHLEQEIPWRDVKREVLQDGHATEP